VQRLHVREKQELPGEKTVSRIYPVRHQLKTWPPYFEEGFQVGDVLELQEWNPDEKEYTGNAVEVRITHILRAEDGDFGLKKGYVMLSFFFKSSRVLRMQS
jgi:hypothetical protein